MPPGIRGILINTFPTAMPPSQNPNSRSAKRKLRRALHVKEKQEPGKAVFAQELKRTGLLVTEELSKAITECKTRVKEIAEDCKLRNRKFRYFKSCLPSYFD
jgi:hypothetical protein